MPLHVPSGIDIGKTYKRIKDIITKLNETKAGIEHIIASMIGILHIIL